MVVRFWILRADLAGVQGIFQKIAQENTKFRFGDHRSIGHLDLDIQTNVMVFCFICIKS